MLRRLTRFISSEVFFLDSRDTRCRCSRAIGGAKKARDTDPPPPKKRRRAATFLAQSSLAHSLRHQDVLCRRGLPAQRAIAELPDAALRALRAAGVLLALAALANVDARRIPEHRVVKHGSSS